MSIKLQQRCFYGLFFFVIILSLAAGPVSYTHLRAHETVLDLVCRLLLEKGLITDIVTDVNTARELLCN